MQPVWIFLLAVGFIAALTGAWFWRKRQRRQVLFNTPLPPDWLAFLEENLPLYQSLPPDLRSQLHGHLQIFMAEKRFKGCNGLEITDEIRLTIAAQACLLLLNRKARYYPGLSEILVYPDAFVVEAREPQGNVEVVHHQVRSGESWGQRGLLILSWGSVAEGTEHPGEGYNTVLHEFAHHLDHEDNVWDGTPVLHQRADYASWNQVMSETYVRWQKDLAKGKPVPIDDYGLTNEAEFFAVLTETFFDCPWDLYDYARPVYDELKRYYRVDPMQWYPESSTTPL